VCDLGKTIGNACIPIAAVLLVCLLVRYARGCL
jgi:hypothetical protein